MISAVTSCYFWRSLMLKGLKHPIHLFNWASDNYPCPLRMKSTPVMQVTALMTECFRMAHDVLQSLPCLHAGHLKSFETGVILLLLQVKNAGRIRGMNGSRSWARGTADVVCNPAGIKRSRLSKPFPQKPCYRRNRPLEMEARTCGRIGC